MKYSDWEQSVPKEIAEDALWSVVAYRLSLFLADVGWSDTGRLVQDPRTRSLADQLYRSLGSISANIAEGYSKSTGKDRARFYEYALGSARESHDWYYKARHILGEQVTDHRLHELTSVFQLLLTMVPQQRATSTRESSSPYETDDA